MYISICIYIYVCKIFLGCAHPWDAHVLRMHTLSVAKRITKRRDAAHACTESWWCCAHNLVCAITNLGVLVV